MAKKRLFGLDPKKLDKLLSIGTEDPDGSDIEDKKLPATGEDTPAKRIDAPSPTASLGIFAEQPGSQIGRYKLLSILGEGGMGFVYLAEQEHPISPAWIQNVLSPVSRPSAKLWLCWIIRILLISMMPGRQRAADPTL